MQSLFNTWSPVGLCGGGHNRLIIAVFVPVPLRHGVLGTMAMELVQEIGKRTANIIGYTRESTFLFQQRSVALQRKNAVSFQNMFTAS